MRIFTTLLLFLQQLLIGYVACQSTSPSASTQDIYYWPIASSQPSLLARIEYDPRTLDTNVLSYTPPKAGSPSSAHNKDGTQILVRVGFFIDTPATPKQWVGSLVSQSALTTQRQKLHLHLSPTDDLYHVSLSTHSNQSVDSLDVDLIFSNSGTQPELNKPVVVNPDGTNAEEPEKTLFQKYWWVFLLVTFLALTGGGGEGQS